MINIGIDYTSAIHQSAGIGRYTREMVKALADIDMQPPQYQLFVANTKQKMLPPAPGPNFHWKTTQLSRRWLERLWYRLRAPLPIERWTGPLTLFHAPDFVLPPVNRNTRTLVTIHDLSFVRHPESVMPGMSRYLNKWVPHSVQQADHVIAVSEATRHDLIELYNTPPEKVSVLYHGVTPEFTPITDPAQLATVRQKYSLGEQPIILNVGTVQPRKNIQRLIQAFVGVDTQATLVIAGGKGWQSDDIYAEVKRQGLTNRVHFTGFVADDDLPALYSAATLLAYPSLYEGFGLPVLESMACGTPVVASNQSSLLEVVGDAGLQVNPTDTAAITAAMQQLLDNADLRQKLSVAGKKQAAKFTWSSMAADLIEIYKELSSKFRVWS